MEECNLSFYYDAYFIPLATLIFLNEMILQTEGF